MNQNGRKSRYTFDKVKLLVVESSPQVFSLLRGVLSLFTFDPRNIHPAYSLREGFESFCKEEHDLLIVDLLGGTNNGIRLTKQIRTSSSNPFVPILMTAGTGNKARVEKARDAGVSDYLVKPFTAKQLAKKIENLIERPPLFVVCETYIGPNRRFRDIPFAGKDKRMKEEDTP